MHSDPRSNNIPFLGPINAMVDQPFTHSIKNSPLYSEDLAPIPVEKRTWSKWNLAALWVGMAVCIPTYLLASYMMRAGLSWQAALTIIGLANLVITIPMVLNGHAGVKYGIPFPVQGRAAFGTVGIHIPSIVRAIVACGWFGVQTWIGGLAIYSIWNAATGDVGDLGLSAGKFIAFGIFWLIQIWFIWRGTESIKWLETWAAPILIIIGMLLIGWGATNAGGLSVALEQGKQLQHATAVLVPYADATTGHELRLTPLVGSDGVPKATEYRIVPRTKMDGGSDAWLPITSSTTSHAMGVEPSVNVQFRNAEGQESTILKVGASPGVPESAGFMSYLLWFTAMVGFWATMAISISDITRYASSQKDQLAGQFIGLPGTMIFYSFVGIFVTSAAVIAFRDVLIAEDAPWDPVSLVSKFSSPGVVIFAQLAMLIATLSTNIAANVIAPANAFSNLFPQKISFRVGGVIAGLIGILICPWWLLDEISGLLIFVSGLLGPVLGILLCDYFIIRKKELSVPDLFAVDGKYRFTSGFNIVAIVALVVGVFAALIGFWVEALALLYQLSWFTGFVVAFVVYWLGMRPRPQVI
ncbi:MAG TPA: NCS1 family nucleobase:cation symporter-1 [Flavobacteriales bacterium]|nr:NCS1 family nucleobase:cation symporter-1 [Flavobacteriales bacterium]